MSDSMQFAPERVEPFWFGDTERHKTAMREVVEPLIFTADDGQRFSGLHVNRDFTDEPPIISLNAMFTACDSAEQRYAAYQYAAAHPDRSVIKIDMPAHGHSDALSQSQLKEIVGARTLTAVAQSQSEAVRRRLPDAEEIVVVGDSLGARVGFDFVQQAARVGLRSQALVGFEPVGLEDRLTPAVSVSYFLREWRQTRQLYGDAPRNQHLNNAYEQVFKSYLQQYDSVDDFSMPSVFRRDPRIAGFVIAHSPLAAGTGAEALEVALEQQPNLSAAVVVGGLSSICRWRRVEPLARRLEKTYAGRMAFDLWPGDSHGLSFAPQQPRSAAYVRARLHDLSTS